MNTTSLGKLTIENLRGSGALFELPFESGKKLTIVYGENGTGKSTICDALEFLGNGTLGSLEKRGLGRTNKYWHSVGKKPSDIAVTLESLENAPCRATIAKNEVVANPSSARPRVEVLRRNQILTLIDANPADKYGAIRPFIDVSGVEASENSLRQLIRELTDSRVVAVARVQENQDTIRLFWESAGKPGSNLMAWADTESRRDPNVSDAEVTALSSLQVAYSRLIDYPERLKLAKAAATAAATAATLAQQRAQDSLAAIATGTGELVKVLESARTYLQVHPTPTTCPLCESAEKVHALDQRVADRLAIFAAFQTAQAQVTFAHVTLQRSEQQLVELRENAEKHARDFEKVRSGSVWPIGVTMPATEAPEEGDALVEWLAKSAELPVEWKTAETVRQDLKRFIGTLRLALQTYNDNIRGQLELDTLLPRLDRALEAVVSERKLFSDMILSEIADEVGRIYEIVHPGEGLNKISLKLDPNRRASLEIASTFCGQSDTPPQAYFSESHLDTLGLCMFVALASLDEPKNTILVLDDVLASVDEPHVERLIEMLYSETIKFRHCIITTHYRPWKQKLRWGWLQNGQCQFIELSKWTNDLGMTLIRSIPDVDRLRMLLAETPPDPQLVCAKAGVILEAALDFLTQLYECKTSRRRGGLYTLGDLLKAIDSKLRKALQVEVLVKDEAGARAYEIKSLAGPLDELIRIAQARNVFGCHFSVISFDLLESDAIGFGQKVLELIEILVDPDAGWPGKSKSGKYWANSGETRRLHPLQQPG